MLTQTIKIFFDSEVEDVSYEWSF